MSWELEGRRRRQQRRAGQVLGSIIRSQSFITRRLAAEEAGRGATRARRRVGGLAAQDGGALDRWEQNASGSLSLGALYSDEPRWRRGQRGDVIGRDLMGPLDRRADGRPSGGARLESLNHDDNEAASNAIKTT